MAYTYYISDAHEDGGSIHAAPGGVWPAHDGEEIRGRKPRAILDRLERLARREAKAARCYTSGDLLLVELVDEDGARVASRTVEVL